MSILCLVRDKKNGSWAAFADCLITSEDKDEGISLSNPLRPNYGGKATMGFFESALEEKIGLIGNDILFGWAGGRRCAIETLHELKSDKSNLNAQAALCKENNCFLLVQKGAKNGNSITFIGPERHVKKIESCG